MIVASQKSHYALDLLGKLSSNPAVKTTINERREFAIFQNKKQNDDFFQA